MYTRDEILRRLARGDVFLRDADPEGPPYVSEGDIVLQPAIQMVRRIIDGKKIYVMEERHGTAA